MTSKTEDHVFIPHSSIYHCKPLKVLGLLVAWVVTLLVKTSNPSGQHRARGKTSALSLTLRNAHTIYASLTKVVIPTEQMQISLLVDTSQEII